MRRFLSILASLSRFATLAVVLMLACLAPQAEALLTSSHPGLSEPIPSQAQTSESVLIIEEIHPVGYADDGECLDLCICVEPETLTRVFYIVKSPTGLDFDDGYSSSGLPYYYGRANVLEEMILYNGYNNVVGFFNGGADLLYGSGLDAAIPQPQDYVTGSKIMSRGMFDSNISVVDRFKLTGVGFFVSFMGLLDVVDYIPDPFDALQKSGKNLANDILQKSAKPAQKSIRTSAGKLSTGMNEAVFWSGIRQGDSAAAKWVSKHGGATLETTLAARGVKLPIWDANNPAVVAAWKKASADFASGAKGTVKVLQTDAVRLKSVWANIEFPALKNNPLVDSIVAVNPETGIEVLLWKR